jgi:hypothetical protein
VSERERAEKKAEFEGGSRCASLAGDLEELKLVGCDERSRELNFRRVTKKGGHEICQNRVEKNCWRKLKS